MTECSICHKVLTVGLWPWCPHGLTTGHGIQTDEAFIGGLTIENLGHEPVTVYSRQDLQHKMAEANCEQRIKWAGPHDKYLTNWAAGMDPYTLDAARALVARAASQGQAPAVRLKTVQTSIRVVHPESDRI